MIVAVAAAPRDELKAAAERTGGELVRSWCCSGSSSFRW
jgi:hypothetical protein